MVFITTIASLKLAFTKGKPILFIDYIKGYWKAKREKKNMLVTQEQASIFRKYRWQKNERKIILLVNKNIRLFSNFLLNN